MSAVRRYAQDMFETCTYTNSNHRKGVLHPARVYAASQSSGSTPLTIVNSQVLYTHFVHARIVYAAIGSEFLNNAHTKALTRTPLILYYELSDSKRRSLIFLKLPQAQRLH